MAQAWLVSFLAESTFLIEQISWVRACKSPKTAAFASSSARLYISRVWVHTGSSGKEMGLEIHMLLLLQSLSNPINRCLHRGGWAVGGEIEA